MLSKLLFLLLYFALLFLVVRVFELAAWYEAGFLASQLVDPLSLSVRKLKSILDERGVSYNGVLEKTELSELVDTSGELTEGEVLTASEEETPSESTRFSCGAHFNEEVEDKKDSAWVIQVIPRSQYPCLPDPSWSLLVKKMSRFGVRTGIFDCSMDPWFCDRKGWTVSNLILTLPQGRKPKDNVVMVTYNGTYKLPIILNWISNQISSRLQTIPNLSNLETKWLARSDSSPLKIILFSHSNDPPLFFSALGVKFTGRFNFGKYSYDGNSSILQNIGVTTYPTYLVITPESVFKYGAKEGEFYTYKAMEVFLKAYHPEINDIFLSSLLVINLICLMELFLSNSSLPRRALKLVWDLGKYNIIVIILWVPLLWIGQLGFMDSVCRYCYRFLRTLSGTHFAASLRRDWLLYGNYTGLLVGSFVVYGVAVNLARKACGFSQPTADDNLNVTEWWNQTMQQYYSLLFRTRLRTHAPIDVSLIEDGLDLLVERLAVPDFWLHPVIPTEYIKDLPVWQYSFRRRSNSRCSGRRGKHCCCGWAGSGEMKSQHTNSTEENMAESADNQRDSAVKCDCDCVLCRRDSAKLDKKKKRRSRKNRSSNEIQNKVDSLCRCPLPSAHHTYHCCHSDHSSSDLSETETDFQNCGKEGSFDDSDRGESSETVVSSPTRDCTDLPVSSPCTNDQFPPHSCNCSGTSLPDDHTHNAPSDTYAQAPSGMIECSDCAICLDSYEIGATLCGLPCGHNYHQKCIVIWLESSNHCCPVCRWPAYKKECKLLQHRE